MVGHQRKHAVRLVGGSAEGDHHHDVVRPDHLARHLYRAAFEGKGLAVVRRGVARRTPKPEHRVLLFEFEGRAANKVGIVIRFEVGQSDDDGVGVVGGSDLRDAARERFHEVRWLVGKSARQPLDLLSGGTISYRIEAHERHRVSFDHRIDDELHAREPNPFRGQAPPAHRCSRRGHVQHHPRACGGDCSEVDIGGDKGKAPFVDPSFGAFGAAHCHLLPVAPGAGGELGADHRRHREMVEALQIALGDGAVGEQGGKAGSAISEEGACSAHLEEGFLLTGEGGVRQVSGGGGGADGNRGIALIQAAAKLGVSRADRVREVWRELRL